MNIWVKSFRIAPVPTVVLFLILCVIGLCLGLILSRCALADTPRYPQNVQLCQVKRNDKNEVCVIVDQYHPLEFFDHNGNPIKTYPSVEAAMDAYNKGLDGR